MNWRKILAGAGWMGHTFFVVEQSSHWSAVEGWRLVAQCLSLNNARATRDKYSPAAKIVEFRENKFLEHSN